MSSTPPGRARLVPVSPLRVDPVFGHAGTGEDLALGGEALQDRGPSGVADESGGVPFSLPSPDISADCLYETALSQAGRLGAPRPGVPRWGIP
jgi:hypothetical protein